VIYAFEGEDWYWKPLIMSCYKEEGASLIWIRSRPADLREE
jgi:hypothetical protein